MSKPDDEQRMSQHTKVFEEDTGGVFMSEQELQNAVYRLQGIVRAQKEALNHWRKQFDSLPGEYLRRNDDLESRVANWVRTRIGESHMVSKERAMRHLEESLELAQAEGITLGQARDQAFHVFRRPKGNPRQEAGGVAVCILGWCAANGVKFRDIALEEIERIEAKPLDQIRGSLARKQDADLVTCVDPD